MGQKLSMVREVVTPLNFVTPPSFLLTPPSCKTLSFNASCRLQTAMLT